MHVDWGMADRSPTFRLRPLAEAPDAGLAGRTTADERLALVEVLTCEAWALTGAPIPAYARVDIPVRVIRRGAPGVSAA